MIGSIGLKKIHDNAVVPTKATPGSSGFDLCTADDFEIFAGEIKIVDTGWLIALPVGTEVQVRPRSGLAARHGITVLNSPGTIDSDYTGPLKVILVNHGAKKVSFKAGDRIAQMVVAEVVEAGINTTGAYDTNKNYAEAISKRGSNGFGSTGI